MEDCFFNCGRLFKQKFKERMSNFYKHLLIFINKCKNVKTLIYFLIEYLLYTVYLCVYFNSIKGREVCSNVKNIVTILLLGK